MGLEDREILDEIPREVQRHRRRHSTELLHHSAVLELVEDVARLASSRKTREPRAPGSDPPRRDCDAESSNLAGHCLDVEAASVELASERFIILFMCRGGGFVAADDEIRIDRGCRGAHRGSLTVRWGSRGA